MFIGSKPEIWRVIPQSQQLCRIFQTHNQIMIANNWQFVWLVDSTWNCELYAKRIRIVKFKIKHQMRKLKLYVHMRLFQFTLLGLCEWDKFKSQFSWSPFLSTVAILENCKQTSILIELSSLNLKKIKNKK